MNFFTLARLGWMTAVASVARASPGPGEPIDKQNPIARCLAAEAQELDFAGVVSLVQPQRTTRYVRGTLSGVGGPAMSEDARFNLASAGKMFTAVGVAQLIDAGKVHLDDSIGLYVKGLTPEASAVTVRQLLNHSSGLGNFFSPDNLEAIQKARTASDLLPLVVAEKPSFPPGSRFQYSNTGFLLLGILIEHSSGEVYADYLRNHIFGPAGMRSSGLDPATEGASAVGMTHMPAHPPMPSSRSSLHGPTRAETTHVAPGPLRPAPEAALRGNPAGGSYSTAPDLEKFFGALLGHKLTSKAMLKELTSAQITAPPPSGEGPRIEYGFGFGVGNVSGHRWFGHNGGAPGVNAEVAAYPDDKDILIVLSNRDPPLATTLYRKLRAMIFDRAAIKACAEGTR